MRFNLQTRFMERDTFNRVMSVREYLKELLYRVWDEEEGFSGKRPFGNSGWQYQLASDLISDGYMDGDVDGLYGAKMDAFRTYVYDLIAGI